MARRPGRPTDRSAERPAWLFVLAGLWVGLVMMLTGWVVSTRAHAMNLQTLSLAHSDQPVLWLLDLAPFAGAWAGYLLGLNQALAHELTRLHERLDDLPTLDEPVTGPPADSEDPTVDFDDPEEDPEATAERQPMHTVAVARFAHELRTPLNAVIGYTDLVLEELAGEGRDDLVADLQRVGQAAHHLVQLMDAALDLARLQAHRLPVAIQDVDLADAIDLVLASVKPSADANRNRLEVQVAPEATRVRADPLRVRQILMNLLGNACKFTADGTVRVVVEGTTDGEVAIRVVDTGIGMSEREQARLFREFAQADAIQQRFGGTGLGLVISQRLAKLMRGRIEVVSESGVGSTFALFLPAADQRRVLRTRALGPTTVLLVVGDPVLLDLMRRVVPDGMQDAVAVTGAQGLERAEQLDPTAVVVADPLPDQAALEVLRRLKERRGGSRMPVLLIAPPEQVEDALAAGAAEVFTPPLDLRVLGRTLARYRVGEASLLLVQRRGSMRRLLKDAFHRDGWTAEVVDDGPAAIRSWRGDLPDLVVAEIGAEDDGDDLLTALDDPTWERVPLLAYSQRTLVGWRLPELTRRSDRVVVCGSDLPEDILRALRDAVGELMG